MHLAPIHLRMNGSRPLGYSEHEPMKPLAGSTTTKRRSRTPLEDAAGPKVATKTQLDPDNNTTVNPVQILCSDLILHPPFSFSESDYAILIMICSRTVIPSKQMHVNYAASLAQSSTPC